MASLPFLPGHSFKELGRTNFGKKDGFDYPAGYVVPKNVAGPMGTAMLDNGELEELSNATARMTYGGRHADATRVEAAPEFVPAHVAFDKKVLMFTGYMKSTVHESPDEQYRVRYFKIYYYLEDDSISISEPEIENSGIQQGAFVKRQRLPKDAQGSCYHWTNLNTGMNLKVYGKVIRICTANEWTINYLAKEGIVVNPFEEAPKDPYLQSRIPADRPDYTYATPSDFDKLKQFLVLDRKVLRFFAVWDDRHNMFGELRSFILHYYLVNDTVELREVHEPNDGHDPFPVLLARQKVPRNHTDVPMEFPTSVLEKSDAEQPDLLSPVDFAVGKVVNVLGRDLLLYDCDGFTKDFYSRNFGVTDFTPVDVKLKPALKPVMELPPYTGIGSAEDSYKNCVSINPKSVLGSKSLPQLLKFNNDLLRFSAKLDTTLTEDVDREFTLVYRLCDDFVSIHEPPRRNSGQPGGKFLSEIRVARPGTNPDKPEYLRATDFYIGARVEFFGRVFVIFDADLAVSKYVEAYAGTYEPDVLASMRKFFAERRQ